MDFLDLLSNFGDLLGPFLVRGLNGDLISITSSLEDSSESSSFPPFFVWMEPIPLEEDELLMLLLFSFMKVTSCLRK